jgi:hypothetical protein
MTKVTDFANRILADASTGRDLDFRAIREEIHDLSQSAESEAEHVSLLQIFHTIIDAMESGGNVNPENIDAFRKIRDQDYHLLLTREILVGENASVELTDKVTAREINAGRMQQVDPLRLAVDDALTKPYQSIEELRQIERDRITKRSGTKGWRSWFSKS